MIILPRAVGRVPTGIALDLEQAPQDVFAQVVARNEAAARGYLIQGGVIDRNFRGGKPAFFNLFSGFFFSRIYGHSEIYAIVFNATDYPLRVWRGERLCRVTFIKLWQPSEVASTMKTAGRRTCFHPKIPPAEEAENELPTPSVGEGESER